MVEVKMVAPTPREEATPAALRRSKIDISTGIVSQLCCPVQYLTLFAGLFPDYATNCNGMACSAQYFARWRDPGMGLCDNQLIINYF